MNLSKNQYLTRLVLQILHNQCVFQLIKKVPSISMNHNMNNNKRYTTEHQTFN